MAKTSTTTTTISPTTITLDCDSSIVNTSYSLDNIVDWQDNITISTDSTISGFDETPIESLTLGKVKLTEEKLEKLDALLDILEGAEGGELKAMLETQILLNKVRNG